MTRGDTLGSSKEARLREESLMFGQGSCSLHLRGRKTTLSMEQVKGVKSIMDCWDHLAWTYVFDPGREMEMTIAPGDAARFLLEFSFVEGGRSPEKQTKVRLLVALLGVFELISERPLSLLEFENRDWSWSSEGWVIMCRSGFGEAICRDSVDSAV